MIKLKLLIKNNLGHSTEVQLIIPIFNIDIEQTIICYRLPSPHFSLILLSKDYHQAKLAIDLAG